MPVNWPAVGLSVLPNLGGFVSAYQTRNEVKGWYKTLNRPKWNPPPYVFAPVWTSLYTGMGYASYLVWKDCGGFEAARLPLALYGAQLALNWAWSPIFFGAHKIKMALFDLVALWGTAALCGVVFYKINNTAGLIFIPYMSWLTLATALNYNIYKNNSEIKES